MNDAAEVVRQAATDDTNIIFGATIDERLTGQVWVTVVATGAMAVLLAALVVLVMTVTGWRVVARDLAALHMSGVPLKELKALLEQPLALREARLDGEARRAAVEMFGT